MTKQLILRKNEEHRLLSGHQWIFSNEVKSILGEPSAGDVVELRRHDDKFLGIGFFNPQSLIAFRLLSQDHEEISFEFFERRILQALRLRQTIYPDSGSFRLIHGEGDFLPGLIVDKYNEYLSVQTHSCGMDRRITLICDVLESLLHPKAIVQRNDSPLRTLEHLPQEKGILRGQLDQTILSENGVKYKIDLLTGQKTGIFLDQRENRTAVRRYVRDGAVLDVFCNEGGFSLNAAAGGARSVDASDVSETAIAKARVNATINQVETISFEIGDAFDRLESLVKASKRYDVVILDPPSFTRNRKTVATALKGYKEINTKALKLLNSGGFLVSGSCSHHVTEETFLETIETSARAASRKIQMLEAGGASPDHPVLPAMPETKYLKFGIFSVQ